MYYKIYECKKCGHHWPSKRKRPEVYICPKCKSATWHKAKKIKYDESTNTNSDQSGSRKNNIELAQSENAGGSKPADISE